ncbi:MAG TPA: Ig-like domain-containing protein, partial [Pyrinomonadaceae bacterium]|nr:Ig-like domain-containing protein [Pyrinomonadaceae bacterium]
GTDLDPTPNTMTINVTAVNDPPSFTIAANPPTVNQDAGPQTVLNFATNISAGAANESGQTLTFNVSPNGTTGTLSFSSAPAIDATTGTLTYTANNGTTGTATFNVTLSDNGSNTPPNSNTSGVQMFTITVIAPNATPVVTTTAGNLAYTENAGAVVIDPTLTVTDADSADLTGATVSITAGFVSAQDTLAFTNQLGITGNYNSGSGVLTLTGTTTVANYQTALRTVTYANSSDNPTASRTIQFSVTDGFTIGSATRGIDITAVNDAPVNTVPAAQTTTEDTPKVFSNGNGNQISVADVDLGANPIKITLTATNGTISLSTTAGLTFTPPADGTDDTTMVFTGTLAAVNTALNGLSFNPTAGFSGAASLQIVSDDQGFTGTGGPLTDTDSVNITVNAVNDLPAGTDNTVSTAEDTAYTFTAADFGFTDPNDTPPNTLLAVKITTLPALGTLTNNNVPVNAGDFIPVANINGGLLKFTPAADGNGTPYTTFTFQVQDNGGGSDLDPTPNTMTINVTAVNDAPVNTVPGPQTTSEDTPKVFSSGNGNQISVADVDLGANPIKITLTATNGTISLSTTAGLTFTPPADGTDDATMVFTGTLSAVNTALNGLSFNPTADFTGAASLQIISDDQGNTGSGGAKTDTDSVNITVNGANDAPLVTATAGNLSYTENQAATAIDPGLTVTDADNTNLTGATVAITGNFAGSEDILAFTNQNGITGIYNGGTGVLTLTGTTTVANYQTALRSVTYANNSENPSTATRTVTFTVNDGTTTGSATRGIAVTSVNDAPINTVPAGPLSTFPNTPFVFSGGNTISVMDLDAGANAIQVTLTATNGTLTLSGTSGLSFSFTDANGMGAGDGTADATMTFRGTLTNVNAALNGMTFTPTAAFTGTAVVTITSNDLGNTGTGGPLTDTDSVNIQVAQNVSVSVQDASVLEPSSGSVNMIFTVTLSAPAPAGGATVGFATQSNGSATPGQDYTTTLGTVSFAAGEQFKTINVPVLSDNKKNEGNETFLVVLNNPGANLTIADGTATGTIIETNTAGTILISELRTSGPAGAGDDFVEILNNSAASITVNGTGGGYGLFKMGATCGDTPVLIGVIPNGTVIPARGHFLFTGSAYSLADYGGTAAAAGDVTLTSDIESDRNVAIFSTASLGGISTANRLDAVGFGPNTGGTCDLFREGTTLIPTAGSVLEYTYFRDECGKKGTPSTFGVCPTGGFTQDSNINRDDFVWVDTTAANTPAGRRLGAPGPQNLGSPRMQITTETLTANTQILAALLDSTKGNAGTPNRVRDTTAIGPNAAQGTMSIRRRFQNNTGAPVTRLRIRVVDISTAFVSGGIADLRVLSSSNITVSVNDSATCTAAGFASTPCNVTVRGTTLETPPGQPSGGGFNSSLSATTITLGTPLAPGASINLQMLLGVQDTGSFKFFFNVEALP